MSWSSSPSSNPTSSEHRTDVQVVSSDVRPPNQRAVSRASVDIWTLWRPRSLREPFRLGLVMDLSTRGARLALWDSARLAVGDEVELQIDGEPSPCTVARILQPTEFAVRFGDLSQAAMGTLMRTVGASKREVLQRWIP